MRIESIFLSFETSELIEAVEEKGFFEKAWEAINSFLWGRSGAEYENFSFSSPMLTLNAFIVAIALGFIIASGVMMYKRRVLGKLVRALAKAEAKDAESARSLSELGLSGSFAIKFSLKHGSLGKLLRSAEKDAHDEKMRALISGEGKKNKGEKIKPYAAVPEKDRYYISEEEKDKMTSLFREGGSSVLSFALTVVLTVAAAAVMIKLVPYLISMLDGAL